MLCGSILSTKGKVNCTSTCLFSFSSVEWEHFELSSFSSDEPSSDVGSGTKGVERQYGYGSDMRTDIRRDEIMSVCMSISPTSLGGGTTSLSVSSAWACSSSDVAVLEVVTSASCHSEGSIATLLSSAGVVAVEKSAGVNKPSVFRLRECKSGPSGKEGC